MPKRAEVVTQVDGRQITLSNLDKVLYPSGFTKGQVIEYMALVAPTAVPHLRGRALTFRRFPNGTDKQGFFDAGGEMYEACVACHNHYVQGDDPGQPAKLPPLPNA